jgi:hypothetical protein
MEKTNSKGKQTTLSKNLEIINNQNENIEKNEKTYNSKVKKGYNNFKSKQNIYKRIRYISQQKMPYM